ncbi:MAG: hypothetical protein FJW27_02305 [Acidimicrobiia bacterium]|nr:hypothetical protein [Acidimicrobiia bacterium]
MPVAVGRCCLVWLIGALLTPAAHATVLVPVDLRELSREAGAIVRGRVVSVASHWTDDRRGVETRGTLDVESSLKGSLGEAVTFRVPGGRVRRVRSIVVGAPQFALDERVIVFLGHRGPSVPHVIGLGQGVYRIRAEGPIERVTPVALVGTATPQRLVRGDSARRPWSLEAFEREVQALARPVVRDERHDARRVVTAGGRGRGHRWCRVL